MPADVQTYTVASGQPPGNLTEIDWAEGSQLSEDMSKA
jgi:hypothetical protein